MSGVPRLGVELLQNRQAASGRRDVRAGVQRRLGVLGRRRAVLGVVLSAQVSPAQGARARGDAEGGRVAAAARRGGVRRGQVRALPEDAVGPAREANDQHRGKGKSWSTSSHVDRTHDG